MNLEVGMYVRADGSIGQICGIEEVRGSLIIYQAKFRQVLDFVSEKTITKASHDIIDLIEVGDYVNGYIVLDIIKDNLGKTYIECGCKDEIAHNYIYDTFYNEDIKSIVIKQQFEAMQYRIGE